MSEEGTNITRIIWMLNRVEGFGPQKFKQLYESFPSVARLLDRRVRHKVGGRLGWSTQFLTELQEALEGDAFEREWEACDKRGIQIMSLLDSRYPKRLAAIYDPPLILYVKGTLVPEDEVAIAMVGTRRPSAYGLRIANRFAVELATRGVTIISGMARGIDGESHRGALQAKGRTIAVLGSGLDVIYPKENAALFEEIAHHGAVVSEFPLGTVPVPFHFPKRNRVISGLAMGVLVVEANQKSGSLITAAAALEEGREVYALPGPIDSVTSSGTNQFIQKGAKLVMWPEDILVDLSPQIHAFLSMQKGVLHTAPSDDFKSDGVLKTLKDRPLYFDEILIAANGHAAELHKKLTHLELQGAIRRELGGRYALA